MEQQDNSLFVWKTNKTRFLLFLICLIGLMLRLYKLGDHNFWFDEFISFYCAKTLVLKHLIRDFQPALYYILLHIWIKVFGSSEFALRSLSMFFGVFSIPLVYRLGKLLFDTKTGLISAFLLSISPLHIWYSQEARSYALSTFLVIVMVYFLFLVLKTNKMGYWLVFILALSIGLFINYFTFFVIVVATIVFLHKENRPLLKRWLKCCFFTFILFLFYSPVFTEQISSIGRSFWVPKPDPRSLLITFENFNAGYNATPEIYLFTFTILSLLFILGAWSWWQEKRKELTILILLIFIPVIFTFLISQIKPIYLDRHLMLFSPFYYLILAAGLRKIKGPFMNSTAYFSISLSLFFCLQNYFSYQMPISDFHHIGVHVKKPVNPAADYINRRFKDEDLIAFSDENILNILYYLPERANRQKAIFVIEPELRKNTFLHKQIKEFLKFRLEEKEKAHIFQLEGEPALPGSRLINELRFKRIWLISSSWPRDGILDGHAEAVRNFLQSRYIRLESKEFDGIFIDLYSKKSDRDNSL